MGMMAQERPSTMDQTLSARQATALSTGMYHLLELNPCGPRAIHPASACPQCYTQLCISGSAVVEHLTQHLHSSDVFCCIVVITYYIILRLPETCRSSSRSSSPVGSKNAEAYRLPVSPRVSEKLLAHGSSRSNLSSTSSYPPGEFSLEWMQAACGRVASSYAAQLLSILLT